MNKKTKEFLEWMFVVVNKDWELHDSGKKGGNFGLFFKGQHYANIRGKAKALKLIESLNGVSKL